MCLQILFLITCEMPHFAFFNIWWLMQVASAEWPLPGFALLLALGRHSYLLVKCSRSVTSKMILFERIEASSQYRSQWRMTQNYMIASPLFIPLLPFLSLFPTQAAVRNASCIATFEFTDANNPFASPISVLFIGSQKGISTTWPLRRCCPCPKGPKCFFKVLGRTPASAAGSPGSGRSPCHALGWNPAF